MDRRGLCCCSARTRPHWLLLIALLFIGSRVLLAMPLARCARRAAHAEFLAGLTDGAQALEQGKPLRFGYLASGFRKNAAQLITIGGVSLVGHLLTMMVMTLVRRRSDDRTSPRP